MKIAEALAERKAAQTKIGEINERLLRVAVVQEGTAPAETPAALLADLTEVAGRLIKLIEAVNRTNLQARIATGETMTAAIARRDVIKMQQGVLDALLRHAANPHFRMRGTEIKYVVTFDIADLQRQRDRLAKEYRELDTAIQAGNWAAELLE